MERIRYWAFVVWSCLIFVAVLTPYVASVVYRAAS